MLSMAAEQDQHGSNASSAWQQCELSMLSMAAVQAQHAQHGSRQLETVHLSTARHGNRHSMSASMT